MKVINIALLVGLTLLVLFFGSLLSCNDDDDSEDYANDDTNDGANDDTVGADDDLMDDDIWDDDLNDDDTVMDDDSMDDDFTDDDTVDDDTIDDDTEDDDTADDDLTGEIITVLTMNLQNPIWNLLNVDDRTQIVADLILDKQPDFVAMQEAAQLLLVQNRAEVLAEMTGYEYVWKKTHEIPLVFEEGIAIMTRLPIEWSDREWLPHPEILGLFERSILGVRVSTELGEIYFYCSHMTTSNNSTEKADQALDAWLFMKSHLSERTGFFAGDLNAEPDSLAMRFLRGEAQHDGYEGDLFDEWIETNPSDPGYTYPSDNPDRRIDYIYLVPGSRELALPLDCERVLAEPVGGVWASDHIGVLCSFDVP